MNEELIFAAALAKKTSQERAVFLAEACAANPDLRAQVESLLKAHDEAGDFLGASAAPAPTEATVDAQRLPEKPGTRIGVYKLLQQVGEGGMGSVYMAEQAEPVKRRVALKIVKPGMDSLQVIARFEAERQALALMDHPNIAKVLDAGTSDGGLPYFVMELVKGIPITRYCDANELTVDQRLDLFISVCQAIQHAHHKGIIHRDIKPSNVLVAEYDERPIPKVIDFGVAKALNQTLTDKTMFTQYGQLVGTLEYMSPEQARFNQLDVDTRSDIYSLGVLLYELLAGSTPVDRERLRSTGINELVRIINEEEPPRPSTRSSTSDRIAEIATTRKADPRSLPGLLRGDLDWIAMKALAKDRNERYQTAAAFAADIRRHLDDQPIEARRPSALGRFRRFVRRNKISVSLGACATLALAIAVSFAAATYVIRLRNVELLYAATQAEEKQRQQRWARESAAPEIRRLLDGGHLVPAWVLAKDAEQALPHDPTLNELWDEFTATGTVDSDPSGATVFVRDWHAAEIDWLEVGATPLVDIRLPTGTLRWRLIKKGHAAREMNARLQDRALARVHLPAEGTVPDGMVYVPGGRAYGSHDVGKFFIDRYEVTNRDFQGFVNNGGYTNRDYWQYDFVENGEAISWEEAMQRFCDQTGRPGPATWSDGRFPAGKDDYPVHGVSWYEAAAYAEYAGKSLPTIHHWAWAAGDARYVVPLSNIAGDQLSPVGGFLGIGRNDVYDMAGNVKEWCWNEIDGDKRWIRGGASHEPGYMFLQKDARTPLSRLEACGFRCVKYVDRPSPEALRPTPNPQRNYELETPASPDQLAMYRRHFEYDRSALLNATLVAHDENDDYRHETVRIDAAYGGEQFDIHLILPLEKTRHHPIVWFPGSGARTEDPFTLHSKLAEPSYVESLVSKGFAVCWPVYSGTFGRNSRGPLPRLSVRIRDEYSQIARDLFRTVDYLQTRDDMNLEKLSYVGLSWGAEVGALWIVLEKRFKAAVLIAGGHLPAGPLLPEIEPFQYVPHVEIPTLMIAGRYDQIFPFESSQMPFYRGLGTADKQIIHFDSGHIPPVDGTVQRARDWLIGTLSHD